MRKPSARTEALLTAPGFIVLFLAATARAGQLCLVAPASARTQVEALGDEAGIWGSLRDGFEAWVYPFKAFWDLKFSLAEEGAKGKWIAFSELARSHVVRPHASFLLGSNDRLSLTVGFFAARGVLESKHLSVPGVLVRFEGRSARPLLLKASFRPSLAPMGMTQPAQLRFETAPGIKAARFFEPERKLALLVTSPALSAATYSTAAACTITLTLGGGGFEPFSVPLAFSLAFPGSPTAESTGELLCNESALLQAARSYWRTLLSRAPVVQSPDEEVNRALKWAFVSLAQLRVHNPYLGWGIVSGYGPSGSTTRPRYAWFFDEITLGSWAFLFGGMDRYVREGFDFLQRYQRSDGKTVHEIDQSYPFRPDYLKRYRYAYIHTDGPVYFLVGYGRYFRLTGDSAFVRRSWPKIRRTLQWCFSVMDPQDCLLRIEPSDWGSAESSFQVWKDTQLELMWVETLRSTARIAREVGESALAERCARIASNAVRSIEEKLWNEKAGAYRWGIDRAGRPLNQLVPHHALGMALGFLREDRVRRNLKLMADPDFSTDWGVRSLSLADPKADPAAYQTGSVWPVWTAGYLLSGFRYGRAPWSFRLWKALLGARRLDCLGPMPEVLHGRFFQRLSYSVPHQLFSEVAVVNGFFEGLLGLEVNVPERKLELRPFLPFEWECLAVRRIPLGYSGRLNVEIRRSRLPEGTARYDFMLELICGSGTGGLGKKPVEVNIRPVLPLGSEVLEAEVNGKPVGGCEALLTEGVKFEVERGSNVISLLTRGGIHLVPLEAPLLPGAPSCRLRILEAVFGSGKLTLDLAGLPGKTYFARLVTDRRLVGWEGVERVTRAGRHAYKLIVQPPRSLQRSASGYVKWRCRLRFAGGAQGSP